MSEKTETLIKYIGGIASVLAIIALLFSINNRLKENCEIATASLRTSGALIKIDDELSKKKNEDLQRFLTEQAAALKATC